MAKKQSDIQQATSLRYKFRFKILDLFSQIVSLLIPWGALVFIAYYTNNSINTLAGKFTFADIGIRFMADFKISEALAYLLATLGVAYGLREKKLRRDIIERLSGRIQVLEKQLDPNRTSSHLMPRGTTRPEDKI